MKGHFKTGTVEGTGAAINVVLGYTPSMVHVINIDGDAEYIWTADMTAGEAYKTIANGTTAQVASGGVTVYAGVSGTTGAGFTIGADTDVNVSAETIMWYAFGEAEA